MDKKINITVKSFHLWKKESAVFPYDHIVIGYRTPGKNYPPVQFSPWCRGHIEINVHDVGGRDNGQGLVMFDGCHAQEILQLVKKERENIYYIVAQCDGGISRSSATAAALSKIINGTDEWVFNSPRYVPNSQIYRMILNTFYEQWNGQF